MLDVVLRAIEVERVPELAEREQISLELAYDGDVVIVKPGAVEQVPESLILEGHLGLKRCELVVRVIFGDGAECGKCME